MPKSLGLYEFNALTIGEQYNLTHNEGTFIDVVIEGDTRYVLYSLYKFWVQIIYDNKKKRTNGYRSFYFWRLTGKV